MIHGQNALDHAGENGFLLVTLTYNGLQPIIQLGRHLVHGFGQPAHFFAFVDRKASIEFATGKTFRTEFHLHKGATDAP